MLPRNTPRFLAVVLVWALLLVCADARAQTDDEPLFDATATTGELFALARDAFGLGHHALAEQYYEAILLRERANLQAMLELSNVYERTGKLEYARGLLIRATRIDPNYAAIERRREAVDDLLKISLTEVTDSLLARGACEVAMPKLSLHLSIEPNNPAVHYKRALCLFEMGRYDAALTDVEASITISPQEPYFLLRDRVIDGLRREEIKHLAARAATLARSDNPRNRDQALDLLGRILELDREHAWARNEFLRLSEPETAAPGPVRDEAPGVVVDAFRAVGAAAVTMGRFAGRHARAFIGILALVLIFQSSLTRALVGRIGRASVLSGQLSRFSVAEVLTMLNAEPHTGVLQVRSTAGRGTVYFENGEPRHCVAGKQEGADALMALIANAHQGRFTFREGATSVERTIDTPLSLLLVEQAHKANGVVTRPGAPGVPSAKKSRMKELLDSKL
jgi:tetratricopeptide (TPR) repeat protein